MSRPQYVHSRREEPEIGPEWVSLGVITGASGLKGAVRLKVFAEDRASLTDFGPVSMFGRTLQDRQSFELKLLHNVKGGVAVHLSGITDRTMAEAIKGVKLYIERDALPAIEEDDSFYYEDLEGLIARDEEGVEFGTVKGVFNFGAGDIIEVELAQEKGTRMYPFRDEFISEVNVEENFMVIDRAAFGDDQAELDSAEEKL